MDRHHPAPGHGAADARARIALDPQALATARAALSVFGPVQRQEPIEWAAEEPLAPDLADFYRHLGPEWVEIDTLGLPFLLFPLERLWDEQAGYRWSRRTGALLADWDEDWTVVATQGADPFIHQASTGRVLMAPGEEGWEDRLPLHQLFPLLVHAALFGGRRRPPPAIIAASSIAAMLLRVSPRARSKSPMSTPC